MSTLIKYLFAASLGLVALIEPTLKFAFVLFFAILIDCISAFDLSRRVKKLNPGNADGKFQSKYALRMLTTFLRAYSVILLMFLVDTVLLAGVIDLKLSNIAAAIFCAIQLWSILENISSANGAAWAKVLQRFLVDKTSRHLNIDLNELNKKDETDKNIISGTI